MTDPEHDRAALRNALNEAGDRAASALRSNRSHRALRDAPAAALPLVLIVPLVGVVVTLARWGVGGDALVAWPWILVGAAALPVIAIGLRVWNARRAAIGRRDALAHVDRHLGLEDRLLTADEFLALPMTARGPFVLAALDDARAHVARAEGIRLPRETRPWGMPWRGGFAIVGAVLLILLSVWIDGMPRIAHSVPEVAGERVAFGGVTTEPQHDETVTRENPVVPPLAAERTPRGAETERRRGRNVAVRQDLPDLVRETEGRLGTGQAAEAEAASSPGAARGAPSSQGHPAKPGKRTTATKRKPKAPKPDDRREPEAPKDDADKPAGSTAGQGASRGSRRNPSVSDWASRDQVATPDDEETTEDDEVEDEDESEDSRGGVQPHLRDRKPPVNRDLRIGFGNRKSPDANGRGGPSAQKKSRGVASLILGVPIPDRVKGQPNPGKTKVTQQRIEPDREVVDDVDATARPPRATPIGTMNRPLVTPLWMHRMVREYFLSMRESTRS